MDLRIFTRDGQRFSGSHAADPRGGAGQQCRLDGGVPERQERADLAVDSRRRLLHEGPRVPLPLHRVPGHLSEGPAGVRPYSRAAARARRRKRRGRAPTGSSWRCSNRPSFASGRALPWTRSSARCTGGSSSGPRAAEAIDAHRQVERRRAVLRGDGRGGSARLEPRVRGRSSVLGAPGALFFPPLSRDHLQSPRLRPVERAGRGGRAIPRTSSSRISTDCSVTSAWARCTWGAAPWGRTWRATLRSRTPISCGASSWSAPVRAA